MSDILLSIHPQWAQLIREGKKIDEVRKSRPRSSAQSRRVYLYETAPVMRITARALIVGYTRKHPSSMMVVAGRLSDMCLTESELLEYAGAGWVYLWHLEAVECLREPVTMSQIGLKRPPISWCYLRSEQVNLLASIFE